MELLIHSQTLKVALLKFEKGVIISSHILYWMYLLIHAEIQVKPC